MTNPFATAALAAVLITAASVVPATAGLITVNDDFTIAGYSPGTPLSALSGSFSLIFDDSADAIDTTGSVLNISAGGISLAGATSMFDYDHSTDSLQVGAYSAGNFVTNAGSNYLQINIANFSTAPTIISSSYSQVGLTFNNASRTGGSLTPVPPAPVPEPTSLALLAAGFAAMAATGARRVRRSGAGCSTL